MILTTFFFQPEEMAYADYDYELPADEDAEDYLDYYEEVSHCRLKRA